MAEDIIPNVRSKAPWPQITSDNIGLNYGEGPRIRVRCKATQGLYYNHHFRYEGDVFDLIPQWVTVTEPKTGLPLKGSQMDRGKELFAKSELKIEDGVVKRLVTAEEQFSHENMALIDTGEAPSTKSAQGNLDRAQAELNAAKMPKGRN